MSSTLMCRAPALWEMMDIAVCELQAAAPLCSASASSSARLSARGKQRWVSLILHSLDPAERAGHLGGCSGIKRPEILFFLLFFFTVLIPIVYRQG